MKRKKEKKRRGFGFGKLRVLKYFPQESVHPLVQREDQPGLAGLGWVGLVLLCVGCGIFTSSTNLASALLRYADILVHH